MIDCTYRRDSFKSFLDLSSEELSFVKESYFDSLDDDCLNPEPRLPDFMIFYEDHITEFEFK